MAETRLPFNQEADISFEVVKSWRSFENHFETARTLRAITFCDSPDLLMDFFRTYELEQMEVIVGDVSDYRERLREEDRDLVDELERLKEEGVLEIYTCPRKSVHSKMYIIERSDGNTELISGSANLTRTGWSNQTNHLTVLRAPEDHSLFRSFVENYRQQKEDYAERFLDDLTRELASSDRDRDEVIEYWVQGRDTQKDEMEELNVKAVEQMQDGEDAEQIVLSLRGFDEDVRDTVQDQFQQFGGSTGSDRARIPPGGFSKFLKKRFSIPSMWAEHDGLFFVPPGQSRMKLSTPPPEPETVNTALADLERYFDTVEEYGETNNPRSVKSHMFEALLYFFWAPFVNLQARLYRSHHIENLDKNLPYLYIYGESNSGKGTFARFALSMISRNAVRTPIDADEVTQKNIRNVRRAASCFPLVVDDIEKNKVNRLEPLKNYWSGWDTDANYPTLVFISNDRKPSEWFRNRAKLLHFDTMFRSTKEGESSVNRVIQRENPLYDWVSHRLLERFSGEDRELEDDFLAPVRRVVAQLYEHAGRDLPGYFPEAPAEEQFDIGRRRWRRLREAGGYEVEKDETSLTLSFDGDLEHWEIAEFRRNLPGEVRAEQEGNRLVIKNPSAFTRWLGADPAPNRGLIDRIKRMFS